MIKFTVIKDIPGFDWPELRTPPVENSEAPDASGAEDGQGVCIPDYSDKAAMQDLCDYYSRLASSTCAGHGGCYSEGSYVLLDFSNVISPYLSNSDRVASYDRLLFHAERVIGAGC